MRYIGSATTTVLIHLVIACCSYGQETPQARPDLRMEYMRQRIELMEVRPLSPDSQVAERFDENAILRFGDATRETADGSIWKLGSDRPQAIVAMEFTRGASGPQLNYEFLCLTDERFELRTDQGWSWRPAGSAVKFQRLENATPPNDSPSIRLRQMKVLAGRFSAIEEYNGSEIRLRMMPRPIDEYVIGNGENVHHGATFVFANGTNPEVLLLLESDDSGWRYALARLCGAEPTVRLGDQVVWNQLPMDQVGKSWRLPYTGEAHAVEEAAIVPAVLVPTPKENAEPVGR